MAVYTHVSAEALTAFLARYDAGDLVSAKGIAEGVENSNYVVDTTGPDGKGARYILTLYERRVAAADLPFFLDLLDHLAAQGLPVPPAIRDRTGAAIQTLAGRPACLIRFLPGVSLSQPTPAQAHAGGSALGAMHHALAGYTGARDNTLGMTSWRPLLEQCGPSLDTIAPGLHARIDTALTAIARDWPAHLPRSVIHADLFPDNVLMLGDRVAGLIDFYFACTDITAYDLAIMHTSWAFDAVGAPLAPEIGRGILTGYAAARALTDAERAALPVLARGACLRFLLTRAWDWLNTPADALVTRKDPLAYLSRLDWYERHPDAFA